MSGRPESDERIELAAGVGGKAVVFKGGMTLGSLSSKPSSSRIERTAALNRMSEAAPKCPNKYKSSEVPCSMVGLYAYGTCPQSQP